MKKYLNFNKQVLLSILSRQQQQKQQQQRVDSFESKIHNRITNIEGLNRSFIVQERFYNTSLIRMSSSSDNNNNSSSHDESIAPSSSSSEQQVDNNNTNFEQVGWNQTKIDRPTQEDIQVIEKIQLKKAITVPNAIVKRCKWGYPQVTFAFTSKNKAETSENTYVPGTFLWLTCPRVNLIIDKVETSDEFNEIRREFGAELNFSKTKLKNQNKRKSENNNSSEKKQKQESEATVTIHESQKNNLLMESFENYDKWLLEEAKVTEGQDKGQALLTPDEFNMWKYSVYEKDLNNLPPQRKRYGNAGVSHPSSIKCLHSHISSYFAGSKDHVGKRAFEAGKRVITEVLNETDIEDLANPLDCRSNCIKCQMNKKD
ncbi:predicted protein [Naegleria gruberi]|uniref:Predicted protein n=1 Tax=Naegleria gruberi TaxID=5762 RepID=D2V3D0_NAEGR|nr:uncharacterized protein NAEGRDRAFT_46370 [Naegleria gruberi]EFC48615.1 predicted protein [Naegleria gruberi]|eukprot:XP_002681359.1 predicted protein [Naegleria gruberi strain NEG-M]